MKQRADNLFAVLEWVLVRSASLVVPCAARDEWRREWDGELCHVREVYCAPSTGRWRAWRHRIEFCAGAFTDARCMRQLSRRQKLHFPVAQGSPVTCLLVLVAILIASYTAARLLPGVRAERALAPASIGSGLVLIQDAESPSIADPTIASFQYRAWRRGRQLYFDGFAFYYVASEPMTTGDAAYGTLPWRIAHTTPNLFALLGSQERMQLQMDASDASLPLLILSEAGWKRRLGADPHAIGRVMRVGGRDVRVAGVAPDGSWALPGHADAWLLDTQAESARGVLGYAIGHLTPDGRTMMRARRISITAYKSAFSTDDLLGVALNCGNSDPWHVFLFASLIALLTLPATTPIELSELNLHAHRVSWTRRWMRSAFFAGKIVLMCLSAYFISMDLAYGYSLFTITTQTYIQLASTFLICLFGLRWALRDQRRRCPVCLRLVTHPARVGLASNNFFAWSGTELICIGGHTLLHIPGMATSWFATPRWLIRDPEWELLLGETAQK